MLDVSIIIVNYNTKKLIQNCIKSIFEQTKDISYEVIVSDNGSIDDSIEMIKSDFPQVILLENNANLGFGIANNRGLKIAKGKYIFYLNSDTVLLNNAVKCFFDYWEENGEKQNIGALGCNLLDADKIYSNSGGCFPSIKSELYQSIILLGSLFIKSMYRLLLKKTPEYFHKNKYKPIYGEIGYICGADLFLKNDKNAYFDENFFLYFEETDLQYQLSKLQKKRLLIKGPAIIHFDGGSYKQKALIENFSSFSQIQFRFSQIYYLKKNCKHKTLLPLLKVITVLIWINPYLLKKTIKHIYNFIYY